MFTGLLSAFGMSTFVSQSQGCGFESCFGLAFHPVITMVGC